MFNQNVVGFIDSFATLRGATQRMFAGHRPAGAPVEAPAGNIYFRKSLFFSAFGNQNQ